MWFAVTIGVACLSLFFGWFLLSKASERTPNVTGELGPPVGVGTNGAIKVGAPGAADVDFYFDYFSPSSRTFDTDVVSVARAMQRAGFANVSYHPLARQDGKERDANFSTRAAGAAYCVADRSPLAFTDFHLRLFQRQPADRLPGLRNDELTQLAIDVGAPPEIRSCISGDRYEDYVAEMTQRAAEEGRVGFPALYVGGKLVPKYLLTPDGVRSLILVEGGFMNPDRLPVEDLVLNQATRQSFP